MIRRGLVAIAATALLLAGCATAALPGGSGAPDETPAPEFTAVSLVPLTDPEVLAYCPDEPAAHLAVSGAEVVGVLRCSTVLGLDSATGSERVERLVDDPADLLAAYAAADAERPTDQVCTLDMADPLILWLELATGETIAVRAPVDACGKPQAEARAALDAAAFETVLEQALERG